ncbi:16S rRNA (guanine(527)-N(7))-methyltransferase RsmG [Actinocrispum wychmicini]|nr:16S rRNA (guanine(527)-N(7))-methyltransferase RsmG [Actinocrispum wychmicini]
MTDVVAEAFGAGSDRATRFAELLAVHGVERGLIGPREVDRLWDRHLLNSVAIAECVPQGAAVVDVGSGAGLPGIPLAIARPDLSVVLLEPMARRIAWLEEVVTKLELTNVEVVRGRAEEKAIRQRVSDRDVATARAVAPLGKLAGWCLPLLRVGGQLIALKGSSAAEEIERDRDEIARAGGVDPVVQTCGRGLDEPATVVVVRRAEPAAGRHRRRR